MAPTLKDKVIDAAVAYIGVNGPEGLSFRQIAADAGVSHQAPYHHFESREAIFTEIAMRGFRQFADVMGAAPRRGEDSDIAVRLLERYVSFALANRGYFRVMFRSDLCRMEESPQLQQIADEAFATLVSAVETMVEPSASVDKIRTVSATMWSLGHGLATLLIDGPLENKLGVFADHKKLTRAVARQAIDGLR